MLHGALKIYLDAAERTILHYHCQDEQNRSLFRYGSTRIMNIYPIRLLFRKAPKLHRSA